MVLSKNYTFHLEHSKNYKGCFRVIASNIKPFAYELRFRYELKKSLRLAYLGLFDTLEELKIFCDLHNININEEI